MWHGTVLFESGWVSCKHILQSLGQPQTKVKKKKYNWYTKKEEKVES